MRFLRFEDQDRSEQTVNWPIDNPWPPPTVVEFEGHVWSLDSCSQLPAEVTEAADSHVAAGALYKRWVIPSIDVEG